MDPTHGNRTESVTRHRACLRWSILVSAALASIGLAGCGPPKPPNLTGIRLTDLKPRAVEVTRHGQKLGGSWMLVRGLWGAIPSDGTGGACLLVAMRDVPGYGQMQCTGANRDCWPPGTVTKPWLTYCDLPAGAAAGAVGQCWGRPFNRAAEIQAASARQSCNLSKDYGDGTVATQMRWTPGVANEVNLEPLDLSNTLYGGLAKPSHWRINACVRDHGGTPFVTKCVWSDIYRVP